MIFENPFFITAIFIVGLTAGVAASDVFKHQSVKRCDKLMDVNPPTPYHVMREVKTSAGYEYFWCSP